MPPLQININLPFCIYCRCEVLYDGRATSTLELGNFLVIHKGDGSIQIQAGNKIFPRNYQGAGGKLEICDNTIISTRKRETIKIIVHEVHDQIYLTNWSLAEVAIIRTEKDLVNKLLRDWHDYIEGDFELIRTEFQTPLGPIDLAGVEANGDHHLVEVKRRNVSVQNVSQLNRYVSVLREQGKVVHGYIAAPRIGNNAIKYCESLGFEYLNVDFD